MKINVEIIGCYNVAESIVGFVNPVFKTKDEFRVQDGSILVEPDVELTNSDFGLYKQFDKSIKYRFNPEEEFVLLFIYNVKGAYKLISNKTSLAEVQELYDSLENNEARHCLKIFIQKKRIKNAYYSFLKIVHKLQADLIISKELKSYMEIIHEDLEKSKIWPLDLELNLSEAFELSKGFAGNHVNREFQNLYNSVLLNFLSMTHQPILIIGDPSFKLYLENLMMDKNQHHNFSILLIAIKVVNDDFISRLMNKYPNMIIDVFKIIMRAYEKWGEDEVRYHSAYFSFRASEWFRNEAAFHYSDRNGKEYIERGTANIEELKSYFKELMNLLGNKILFKREREYFEHVLPKRIDNTEVALKNLYNKFQT